MEPRDARQRNQTLNYAPSELICAQHTMHSTRAQGPHFLGNSRGSAHFIKFYVLFLLLEYYVLHHILHSILTNRTDLFIAYPLQDLCFFFFFNVVRLGTTLVIESKHPCCQINLVVSQFSFPISAQNQQQGSIHLTTEAWATATSQANSCIFTNPNAQILRSKSS